jgi:hypothetical protein
MVNSSYTNFTTGLTVLNPSSLDGTPYFQADSTGLLVNGSAIDVPTTTASVTAHAGGGQGSATALTANYNLVTVCATNFDSVKLAPAAASFIQTVKNIGAAILSVFPASGDAINGLAVNLSIDIPVGGEVTFTAVDTTTWETRVAVSLPSPSTQKGTLVIKAADSAGNTQTLITNASQAAARTYTIPDAGASASFSMTEGAQTLNGIQTYGAIKRNKATNAITAFATGGQGSATALVSEINSITVCATAGDSVKLPTSVAGMVIQVSNLGAAAAAVFPVTGDVIDALAANASVSLAVGASIIFTCSVAGSWKSISQGVLGAKFTTGTTTTTFTAGQLTGAQWVSYASTAATPGSIATRTAAEMFADDPYARVGGGYRLRVSNTASGAATMTITAGSNVTLTGTATVADATYRDFVVTYTSATALVIQNIGSGSI